MILVLIAVFFVLMVLAVPVGHVLVIASGAAVWSSGTLPLTIVAQQMFQQTQSFPMLALPFFMLAGSLMMGGRLGQDLLDFATTLVQRWRGGLASTTVVASVVFGGVSGSAVADATALGSVLIPWQKREGYPAGFVAANNSAPPRPSTILIPPSIPMILFSLVSRRQRRGPVRRRRPARHRCWRSASSSSATCRPPARLPASSTAGRWQRFGAAVPAGEPGAPDAGPDPASRCASASRRRPRSRCWRSSTRSLAGS